MAESDITILPKELQPFVLRILATVVEELQRGHTVPSAFFLGSASGEIHCVELDSHTYESKLASAKTARNLAYYVNALFVITLSESWGLPDGYTVEQSDEVLAKYGSIGAFPGKTDLLFLHMEAREGTFAGRAHILPCPPSKKKRRLGAFTWFESDHAAGILTGILPSKPPTASTPPSTQ